VVSSEHWDNGVLANAGAATWGSGTTGITGVISAANSLVGSTTWDLLDAGVTALSNGNYVVWSPYWHNGAVTSAGAVTWCSGSTGRTGAVSAASSLIGSTANDVVGSNGVTALSNGNYVVCSPAWDNGTITNAGAATWCSGLTGRTGAVSAANSLVGATAYTDLQAIVADDVNETFLGRFLGEGGGRVRVGRALVDHVAPAQPTGLVAAYSGGQTNLGWSANTENDLDSYRIYRATSADFTPALDNRIATQISTSYADVGPAGRYYKVSAVDVNGNESGFALITPDETTEVDFERPVAFALEGVRPNPANRSRLNVAFALPSGAAARLDLIDVSGRRVISREVGSLGAGRHTVNLSEGRAVAPGLYWVRFTQGANERAARVAVIE